SVYSMDAAGSTLTPLYLNSSFSYGNGPVYIPSLHTDTINEFAGSAGVNISGFNIDENVIKSTQAGSGPVIESGSSTNYVNITCDNVIKITASPNDVLFQSGKVGIDVNGNFYLNDSTKNIYFGSNAGLTNTALQFNGSPALTASTLTISGNTALTSSALSFAGVTALTPTALSLNGSTALTSSALSFAGTTTLTPAKLSISSGANNDTLTALTTTNTVG